MTEVSRALKKSGAFSGGETAMAFDLRSWQGLTEVLQAARKSLSPQNYSEFRDLVLEYAQSGGTPELKEKIDKIITSFHNEAKSGAKTAPLPQEISAILRKGHGRPEVKNEPVSETGDTAILPKTNTPEAQKVDSFSKIVTGGRVTPVFKSRLPAPKTEALAVHKASTHIPVAGAALPYIPKVVTKQEREAPSTTEISATIQQKIDVAPETPKSIKNLEEYKTRIIEIKRDVNARFGNPVMLMDSNNNAGRTYMNALLAAVKASGGGQAGALAGKMEQLEAAYKAILETSPDQLKRPPHESIEQEVSKEEESEVRAENNPGHTTAPVATPTSVPTLAAVPQQNILQKKLERGSLSQLKRIPLVSRNGERVKPPRVESKPAPDPVPEVPPLRMVQSQSVERAQETAESISKIEAPAAFPKTDAHKNTEQSDKLSPQVTEALERLLHEWPLFKSSGIFGTGPNGSGHPLYRKLSALPMSSVLAGRWNDANPETIKSIKDYVNAWRHEQGVAYTVNETFEDYLRRVIVKILRRQN